MLNKRRLHHALVALRRIKLWQLLLLLVVMTLLTAFLLRQNNLGMVAKRNMVKMADEKGGDVAAALTDLQNYVTTHMNTNMGDKGIYLEKTYQRAYDRAIQQALSSKSANSVLYQQADQACRPIFSRTASYPAYTQCVADKVAAQGPAQDPLSALKAPSTDLYRHNYVSPFWSADAAGFAAAFTIFILLIIVGRIFTAWLLRLLLRHRYR